MCWARDHFEVALWSHYLQGYLPLHELLFCDGKEIPLKLPYTHIAYKGTSPLHEVLFCVGQDSPLKLPYGYIAYKGTSPLYELLTETAL